jgi:hypothetical protein
MLTKLDIYLDDITETFDTCFNLVKRKSADYASPDDPLKSFRLSAEYSGLPLEQTILIRFLDKVNRLANFINRREGTNNESFDDSILDAINYLAIMRYAIAINDSSNNTDKEADKEEILSDNPKQTDTPLLSLSSPKVFTSILNRFLINKN